MRLTCLQTWRLRRPLSHVRLWLTTSSSVAESSALQGRAEYALDLRMVRLSIATSLMYRGWSCPEGTPLKTQNTDLVLNDLSPAQVPFGEKGADSTPKSFIADFDMAANFCNNPDLMGLVSGPGICVHSLNPGCVSRADVTQHHILLSEKHRAAVDLVPVVMTCRVMWNSDVLGVPLDGVHGGLLSSPKLGTTTCGSTLLTLTETVEYVPWEKKDIAKAFWVSQSLRIF